MKKAILVFGNPVDGFSYVGPFDTHQEASDYGGGLCTDDWWVAGIEEPQEN